MEQCPSLLGISNGTRLSMNQKELKELIEFLIEKNVAEFELERGDVKVKIKRAADPPPGLLPESRYFAVQSSPVAVPPPATPAPPTIEPATGVNAAEPDEDQHIVRSPIVGTFYE